MVPIADDPNAHTTYETYDVTAYGGDDHWCFAPMIHLAFGEMVKAFRPPAVGCALRSHC